MSCSFGNTVASVLSVSITRLKVLTKNRKGIILLQMKGQTYHQVNEDVTLFFPC